jgi:excisionase family DNA binding protein
LIGKLSSSARIGETLEHGFMNGNELVDIRGAAEYLNVSETSLRRWTNAGRLRCLRIGQRRERRFRRGDLLAFLEGNPSEIAPSVRGAGPARISDWSRGQVIVTQGSHLCGVYASDLGLVTLVVPFLLEGLEEGSVSFLVGSLAVRKSIVKYLKRKRPSLQADVDTGRLVLSSYRVASKDQCGHFCKQIEERVAEGVQSFRVVGDTWQIRSRMSKQSFAEYEAGYDRLVAQKYPVVTLCTYDARKFSGVELLDALKGHRDIFRYPLERALA